MEKQTIIGVIIGLLLLSFMTIVYAHMQQNEDNFDYMDEMHEEMVKSVDDPELRQEINEMHEDCEEFHDNTLRRYHVMGMDLL